MGGTQIHCTESANRIVFVGAGLLRNEASAFDNCRSYQCYATCHGADRRLTFFGERLNVWQWIGVSLAIISFLLLSRSGKKEGIDFKHDNWIYMIIGAAMLGAVSGLYDKFLMAPESEGGVGLDRMMVQSWYNIYQCFMMLIMLMLLWWPKHKETTPFHWDWAIIGVSVFLSTADFMYFYAVSIPAAMISIVSMIRRGSVIVSFLCGAMLFHEKNLKAKAVDLALVLLGMIFLYIGSR